MRESALLVGRSHPLVGVITHPAPSANGESPLGALLLNAGILHHVGPHRLHVHLARRLATLGFVALRLDFSGIGDTPARTDGLPFEQSCLQETREAMDALVARFGCRRFVLLGLCSGARVSLRVAAEDERVAGALLINAANHLHDGRDEAGSTALRGRVLRRHYWRLALLSSFRAKVWRQALRGNFDPHLARQVLRDLLPPWPRRATPAPSLTAPSGLDSLRSLLARGVIILHVYSEGDQAIDYFRVMLGPQADGLPLEWVPGANHTFTPLWCQERLLAIASAWAVSVLEQQHESAAEQTARPVAGAL